MRRFLPAGLSMLFAVTAAPAFAVDANPAGELVTGSGEGVRTTTVYSPDMRYPIEETPSFANSQVYGHGGYLGPDGGQCNAANYSFPWTDNFCESRSYSTPLCPAGQGHQGQDIRPATCDDDVWWAVAAEAGTITGIGSYTVTLTTAEGRQYRYLHMNMADLAVGRNDTVAQGQRLGRVSNDFGGTATTIHLHFEISQNVASVGGVTHVPPYTSLVESYEELEVPPEPCPTIGPTGGIVDDAQRSCFRKYGSATYWRPVSGQGHDGSFIWTHGFPSETPSNWAEWSFEFDEAGIYRIEASNARAWVLENGFNQSEELVYRVEHAGRTAEFVVDQSAGDGWVTVGDVAFASGGSQSVAVLDNTGEPGSENRKIVVDAIRLTRLDDPVEGCDATSCAATSGCEEWSACVYPTPCALSGTQERTCTTFACDGDVCAGDRQTESRVCTRETPQAEDEPWADTSPCVLVEGGSVCAQTGSVEQERHACVDGQSVIVSQTASCEISSDGRVVDLWSPWSECVGSIETSERGICSGGEIVTETRNRACEESTADDYPARQPPTTSRTGCGMASGAGLWGWWAMLALLRRRR